MRQIIHTYKLRLTNLSQGNRSLKLSRLSTRRDIDWRELGFLEKDSPEELLRKVIAGKDLRLLQRLDPRHEATNQTDRRLNNIYREANTLFEETGTYDLFVGYPFVEGRFVDGTAVRSPVLLFPVRLHRNLQGHPRWTLEVIKEDSVHFNKTFFLAYEQYQQARLPQEFWEEEVDRSNDWQAWMNEFYQKIKGYELDLNFNSRLFDFELSPFNDYGKARFESFGLGNLTFQPQAVLGIFPQSDSSLLQDYETIENHPEAFDLEPYFSPDQALPDFSEKSAPYIREEDRYFVTPVDQSQEDALLQIKQGQSLVIHGPPGTGKSQVIVNIIADALAHGKKVLLVSQKRAALDVVYKRLGAMGLSRFAVLLHDYRHDRKGIYRKLQQQIDDIDVFKQELRNLNLTRWEHDYKLVSRQADQFTRLYDELNEALTTRQACGMSMHELYLSTDAVAEILPLEDLARELDLPRLEQLLEKLLAATDYREFFAEDYPWRARMSFHHFGFDDQKRIVDLIAALPGQLEALFLLHQPLAAALGTDLLDNTLNQEAIDQYQRAHAILSTPSMRQDIEAIQQDELTPEFVKEQLSRLEDILEEMDSLQLLADFPWTLYAGMKKHLFYYREWEEKNLRFFNLRYQQARWFLKKILEEKGRKLEPAAIQHLEQEFVWFSRLHTCYSELYELAFFQDFPLLESLESKNTWWERKQKHFLAFQQTWSLGYFPARRPHFSFGRLDEAAWSESMQLIQDLSRFTRQLRDHGHEWGRYLTPAQVRPLLAGVKESGAASEYVDQLARSFRRDFADLRALDSLLAGFSSIEHRVLERLLPTMDIPQDVLVQQVRNSVYFYWIEQVERQYPVLAEVSGRGWPRKREEYAQKLSARREKVAELIQRKLKEALVDIIQYNRLKNPVTYRKIYHEVTKKRRIWSVRRLVKESWESGLDKLAPCWLASPESASAIFPMEKDFFDVVIFDEASQCFVERAIPIMLRGKQSVIAGDDKQLPPFDLYKVKYEESEAEFVEKDMALEVESVLDLAKRSMAESKLSWHYRSHEEDLINFSNHAFYEGKLQVIPASRHETLNSPPLEWISVAGKWQQNCNLAEAERVIDLLLELVQRADSPSLGVVTFNYHQQELIKDRMDARLEQLGQENEALYHLLQTALHKTEQEEFQGLFVKNIENVQGDERDIIIFSVAYAHDEAGRLVTRYGLLNQAGGENRLNVAITRARHKIYVICSFDPALLKVEAATHAGPRFFKAYLQYVKAISEERKQDALHLLNLQAPEDLFHRPFNPIADALAAALQEKGFHVVRDLGDTRYKLDLAVKRHPEDPDFLLGVECEGPQYFGGNDSKEREVYRWELLRSRGWRLHRVWARNWWKDKEGEIARVLEMLTG